MSSIVPEGKTWLRAIVAAIPYAGGALDHLFFDKAEIIRNENIENSIKSLSEEVDKINNQLHEAWFSSEEALAMFKKLFDSVSFEPDKQKISSLGKIVAYCGTEKFASDPRKLSVFEHISKLSYVQIKLLNLIKTIPLREKKISSGDIVQTGCAIWLEDIVEKLKSGPNFWTGTMVVDQEMEILESVNVVRRSPLSETGYLLTSIGSHAAEYLNSFASI